MLAVAEETGFTTYLAVMRSDRMVVMVSVDGSGPLRFMVPVGEARPLQSTSAGQAGLFALSDETVVDLMKDSSYPRKTLLAPGNLAELRERQSEVRRLGYASSWEMMSTGIGSFASPVVNAAGKLATVLTLDFSTGQMQRAESHKLGENQRRHAQARNGPAQFGGCHDDVNPAAM